MFSNRASSPWKGSVPIRAFMWSGSLCCSWAVMCISTHLPSRLECQQRSLNWKTPCILDNLIGYRHLGDILIKVLSWFCLERDQGRPSACVTEIREQSNIASVRKTEIIFKVSAGAAFWNPWSPDPPCPSGFLLHDLVMGGISCVSSRRCAPEFLFYFFKEERQCY